MLNLDRIIFGTYKKFEVLEDILPFVYKNGITRVDTAQLYRNESKINDIITKNNLPLSITTKISKKNNVDQTSRRYAIAKEIFGDRLDCILLHNKNPYENYKRLVTETKNSNVKIGVSNYTVKDLELLEHKPDVIQIEFHPFINVQPIVSFCKMYNIKIQAHTVLAQAKYFNLGELVVMANKYNTTPQLVMLQWAYQYDNVDLVLSSSKTDSILEWLKIDSFIISEDDHHFISGLYMKHQHIFYPKQNTSHILDLSSDTETFIDQVVDKLKSDNVATTISDIVTVFDNINTKTLKTEYVYQQIIKRYYNNHDLHQFDSNFKKFQVLKRGLLNQWHTQRKSKIKICKYNPIYHPTPMPVTVTDTNEFYPIFDYLKLNQPIENDKVFIKGTVFKDARLDMCKQVVGYKSIGNLCDVTLSNKYIKHFLLGNNISFESPNNDIKIENAKRLYTLIKESEIETWYLAGNCIDQTVLEIICGAFYNDTTSRALWLKRNPIHTATCYIRDALNNNTQLELLDLSNCGLLNNGLQELFKNFSNTTLKTVYLDANGITDLSTIFTSNNIISDFYLSLNPLQNVNEFLSYLKDKPHVTRLCLASCGLTDDQNDKSYIDLDLINIPNLEMLDLGMYKSTNDLGMEFNKLTVASIPKLHALIKRHPKLRYLSLLYNKITQTEFTIEKIPDTLTIYFSYSDILNIIDHETLRFIRHPNIVKNIDSIYRGKM